MRRLRLPLLLFALASPALADGPVFDRSEVPATGTAQAHLQVPAFDRYAISVDSPTGTAIQLVERMGRGPSDGQAGERDGRLDVFLDAGEVRIETEGVDPHETVGPATLRAARFVERNPAHLRLDDQTTVQSTLVDLEQRAWWVEQSATGPLVIEAIGRHVADLRIWHDGDWLDPTKADCTTLAWPAERPQRRCMLDGTFGPGLYRVAVYGGPGLPWATPDAEGADTMYLRRGLPELGEAGELSAVMGPFGVARWRVPKAEMLHLRLPRHAPARLERRTTSRAAPVGGVDRVATLAQVGGAWPRRPHLTVHGSGAQVIEAHAAPGQPFTFTWYSHGRPELGTGTWLISSVHPTPASDRVPTTAFVATPDQAARVQAVDALRVGPGQPYAGRFNLSRDTETIIVEITEPGAYRFDAPGAWLRVQPHWLTPPEGYVVEPMLGDRVELSLDRGRYQLEIRAREPGVARLTINSDGDNSAAPPRRPGVLLPAVSVALDAPGACWPLHSPDIRAGWVARRLPIDPSSPVPLPLLADEVVPVPLTLPGRRVLEARLPDGRPAMLSVNLGPWRPSLTLAAGEHGVRVRNTHDAPALITLAARPPVLDVAEQPRTKQRPTPLPRLTPKAPRFADYDLSTTRNWRVQVSKPGLYQLESTGLLATKGALRSRTRPYAASERAGSGHNFRMLAYLRSGDYRLAVQARNKSVGRAGVQFERIPIVEAGPLRLGTPSRRTVPARHGVRHTFEITEAGRYGISSRGRGTDLRCRIEDARGYPRVTQGACDTALQLTPGTYHLVLFPGRHTARQVSLVERLDAAPTARVGHGPHPLPFGAALTHQWREPAEGAARTPDRWTFTLPASATVSLRLSPTMAGTLTGPGGAEHAVQGAFEQRLAAGDWTLAVRAARRDDRRLYEVSLDTEVLLAGQRRGLRLPAKLTVVAGRAGRVVLRSEGEADVRARLVHPDGTVVARDDDRPDGWNVRLTPRLEPGVEYTLHVDEVRGRRQRCQIAFDRPVVHDAGALAVGETRAVPAAPGVSQLRLPRFDGAQLLDLKAEAQENIALSVEVRTPDGWRAVAEARGRAPRLRARPVPDAPHRVLVEPLDGTGGTIGLRLATPTLGRLSAITPLNGRPLRLAADAPTVVALDPRPEALWICPGPGTPCTRHRGDRLGVDAAGPWLVGDGGRLGARPVTLRAAQSVPVHPGRPITLALGMRGPAVVFADSATAQPLVHPVAGPATRAGVTAGTAVTVTDGPVRVHSAHPAVVRVAATGLHARTGSPVTAGAHDGVVEAGVALSLPMDLPGGGRLRITLGRGLVLDGPDGVWHAASPRVIDLDAGRRLRLLNPTDAPVAYAVEAQVGARTPLSLAAGAPLEWTAAVAGARRVPVAAARGVLRLDGAVESAWFIDADGHARPAEGAPVDRGGALLLQHGVGPVLAWVHAGDGGAWPTGPSATAVRVAVDRAVPLSGHATTLALAVDGPRLAQVQVSAPFTARLTAPGAAPRLVRHPEGGVAWLWLPAGRGTIALRGLAGAPLWGAARVTLHRPRPLAADGPGATVALAPGAVRVFRFETRRPGPVGAAVRADAEAADLTLLDAHGAVLSTGPAVYRDLTPGAWLLVLSLPPDAAPTAATPVLAGLDDRGDGPPRDVIKTYLSGANR